MDDLVKGSIKQIGNLGKGLGKAATDEAKQIAKATAQQVGIERAGEEKGKQLEQASAQHSEELQAQQNQDTQDFLKQLYGPSEPEPKQQTKEEEEKQKAFAKFAEEHKGETPEKIQELYQVRQRLHKESYYDPLVAKSEVHDQSTIEEQQKNQETTQQRMERMQQEDLNKKQEEDKKKQPIAVNRAQTNIENKTGSSG